MYFDKMDVVIDTYRNKQKGWSFAYMTRLLHDGIFHVGSLIKPALCDMQMGSDYNMSETLTHRVK